MDTFKNLKLSLSNTCAKLNGSISFDVIGNIIPIANYNNEFFKDENKICQKYGEIIKSKTGGKIRKTYLSKNKREKCLKNASIFKIGVGEKLPCKSIILQVSSIIISGLTIEDTKKLIHDFMAKIVNLQNLINKIKEKPLEEYIQYVSKFKMLKHFNDKFNLCINKNYDEIDENLDKDICQYLLQMKNEFNNYQDFIEFLEKFYNLDCLYIFENPENIISKIDITMYSYLIKLNRKIIKIELALLMKKYKFITMFDYGLCFVKLTNYFYKKDDIIYEFEYIDRENLVLLKTEDNDKCYKVKEIDDMNKIKKMEIYKTTFIVYATGTIKFTGTNYNVMETKYEYFREIINNNIDKITA